MDKLKPPSQTNYQSKINILIQIFGIERIKIDELLKYHTFSKLGGPAEIFYIATTQKELINILNTGYELKLPLFVFGNGTKILISEKGMKGLVIRNRTSAIKISGIKGKIGRGGLGIEEALIEVDSGVSLSKLNDFLSEQHLKKFQGFSSLKATLGGSLLIDPQFEEIVSNIKIWEDGEIFDSKLKDLKRYGQVVISAILKVKAY